MASLLSYMPQHPGLLPQWLLIVAVISIGNSVQAYTTMHYTQRVYNGNPSDPKQRSLPASKTSPATPLSARTFATWSFISGLTRIFCAYNMTSKPIYELTMLTWVTGIVHFGSELLVFKTARLGVPVASPIIVATTSLTWMLLEKTRYLG